MLETVLEILKKYNLAERNKILLVGLSGGADSVCLSDILYKLSLNIGFKIIFCHLNHNWRGEHSLSDMQFCMKFAKERNIEILTEILSKDEKQTETNARELRYKFFKECQKKTRADAILLAHNKNDKVETLIYRIIKGTGIKGLSSIKEKRDDFIRPLINTSRYEIEEYCKSNNLEYVSDYTNFDNNYNRNYIRNEILPKFEKINSKYLDNINNLAKIAEADDELIEELIKNTEKSIKSDEKILTDKYNVLSENIKKRIILNIYLKYNIDYDLKRINDIYNFIEKNKSIVCGSKISLTKDLWLFVSKDTIEIITKSQKPTLKISICKEGKYQYLDYIFEIKKYDGDIPEKYPDDKEFKAYVEINEPINFELRSRKEGDYIQPLGLKGTQKLKKYLNSKKIKNHEKDYLIFLCKDNEVYWAPPYGLNDKIKVVSKPNYVISLNKRKEQ